MILGEVVALCVFDPFLLRLPSYIFACFESDFTAGETIMDGRYTHEEVSDDSYQDVNNPVTWYLLYMYNLTWLCCDFCGW